MLGLGIGEVVVLLAVLGGNVVPQPFGWAMSMTTRNAGPVLALAAASAGGRSVTVAGPVGIVREAETKRRK